MFIVLTCALGVAVLIAVASAYTVWRTRNAADERVADAVQHLATGMQQTMRDLAAAVETAQSSRPDHSRGELAASLDLEDVTERTLEAAATVLGVEAVVLDAAASDGARVNAAVGMPIEEAVKAAIQ